jgi:hypothetical protein
MTLGKPKYGLDFFSFNLWHWQRWPFSLEFLGILLRMFLVNWAHNAIRKICKLKNFKIEVRQIEYRHGFTRKWYFVIKIVLIYCEKKMFQWSRNFFEIRGWKPRICKIFEISRTNYSKSERPEQFLVTEFFLTCSWRFLILEQLNFKLEKNIGI